MLSFHFSSLSPDILTVIPFESEQISGQIQTLSWVEKKGYYDWVCLPEATVELIQNQQNQV